MSTREKWKIYFLTFVTYALIHSIRTAWSALKPILNKPPYMFSSIELGQLDMTVLLSLGIGLNLFGWMASRWNVRAFLLIGILILASAQFILASIVLEGSSYHPPYYIVYGAIGMLSFVGWPSCFYIMSKYFSKKDGIALCAWNGSSQAGDFIALYISYQIIDSENLSNNQITSRVIIAMAILLILIAALNYFTLHIRKPHQQHQQPLDASSKAIHDHKQPHKQLQKIPTVSTSGDLPKVSDQIPNQQSKIIHIKNKSIEEMKSQRVINNQSHKECASNIELQSNPPPHKEQSINFLNVWCLPSVALLVTTFSMIKAVNSIIVNWLVFYLALVELRKESNIITIAWSLSIVIGGILGAYFNAKLDKKFFIGALLICSVLFVALQEMHVRPHSFEVLLLIVLCGLLFGGPYNLMGTAVPLMLGEMEEIKSKKGAMAAIVSAMEGGAMLIGALFMVMIPSIGVIRMHWIPAILCFASALILLVEEHKRVKRKKNVTETSIAIDDKMETSVKIKL